MNRKKVFLAIDKDGTGDVQHYICKTCKNAFLGNKMPSRRIFNECRTAYQPDSLKNMKEVEVSLISQNLQFKKIFRLPRSRWAQWRDRVINRDGEAEAPRKRRVFWREEEARRRKKSGKRRRRGG